MLKNRVALLEEKLEAIQEARADEAEERLRDVISNSKWHENKQPQDY